jgi:FKBP-type peptidyl-prolyl cis-trans isomerase
VACPVWADDATDLPMAPSERTTPEIIDEAADTADAAMGDAPLNDPVDGAAPAGDGLDNSTDRLSYAIGMDMGGSFRDQGLEVNPQLLAEAFIASFNGRDLRLTEEQAQQAIMQFQQEMQAKQMQEMMQQQEAAAAENTAAGSAFLEENKAKEGVEVTDSGLQYKITEEGDGPKPGPNDMVTVHYKGQLLDGTVFDSSYDRGEPATFGINQVIPGFGEGLQLMPVGSKGVLYIPGDQAYGMGNGPGGPNSTLIFDIEVIDTESPAAAEAGDMEAPEALGD